MTDTPSDYIFARLRDHVLGVSEFAKPSTIYLALFTDEGAEVAGGGYARVNAGPSDSSWAAPVGGNGTTSNLVAFTFATPSANWDTVISFAVFDAPEGGHLLARGMLRSPLVVRKGDTAPCFGAGALVVTLSHAARP